MAILTLTADRAPTAIIPFFLETESAFLVIYLMIYLRVVYCNSGKLREWKYVPLYPSQLSPPKQQIRMSMCTEHQGNPLLPQKEH